ncbi:hypothetical protein ACA758_04085 [Mycoplasmopsis agassizii]|uniref:hypothetical protein n=1 Tax=Mycoplasmopsis agassizii TaxID=33922 RepID=UPI0035271A66
MPKDNNSLNTICSNVRDIKKMDKVHFIANEYKKEGLKARYLLDIEGEDMEKIEPPVPPVPPVPPGQGGSADNEYATVGYVKQAILDSEERTKVFVKETVNQAISESEARTKVYVKETVNQAISESEARTKVYVKETVNQAISESEARTKVYVKEIVDKAIKEATAPIIAELAENRKENKETKKTLDKILALMEESNKKK